MSEPTGFRSLCDKLDAAPVNPEVTQLCCALRDWSVDLLMDQRERVADLLESLVQPEPQGPTDYELAQLFSDSNRQAIKAACSTPEHAAALIRSHMGYARAVLARWGRPAIEPQGPSDQELLRIYGVATPCYHVEEYKKELDFARAVWNLARR